MPVRLPSVEDISRAWKQHAGVFFTGIVVGVAAGSFIGYSLGTVGSQTVRAQLDLVTEQRADLDREIAVKNHELQKSSDDCDNIVKTLSTRLARLDLILSETKASLKKTENDRDLYIQRNKDQKSEIMQLSKSASDCSTALAQMKTVNSKTSKNKPNSSDATTQALNKKYLETLSKKITDKTQIAILVTLFDRSALYDNMFAREVGIQLGLLRYHLDILEKQGLISVSAIGGGYELSSEGRAYVVESRLVK